MKEEVSPVSSCIEELLYNTLTFSILIFRDIFERIQINMTSAFINMMNMVQATIDIEDRTTEILNIIKVKYGLKDESEAIDFIVAEYEEEILEPELKPEFVEEMKRIMAEEPIGPFNNVDELKAYIESLPDED